MVKHDIDSWITDEETLAECYREKGNTRGYEGKMELVGLLEQLKEYQQLEEQGRLIKLPCKVGDTIYAVGVLGCETVEQYKVIKVDYHSNLATDRSEFYIVAFSTSNPKADIGFYDKEFGKNVFLTKSEAEAKLKELRDMK